MCGLFGAITSHNFTLTELETLTELGVVSTIRGQDSTGVATVQRAKKGRLEIKQKHTLDVPAAFMYDKATQTMMKDKFLVMGHARAATYGAVNLTNAHPIHEGRFIGCHNGSIWHYAPPKVDEHKLTDSRLLYRAMHAEGTIAALKKVGTSGAYALTYIDTHQRTLNLIRNKERPLFLMHTKGRTLTLWASEYRFLDMVSMGSTLSWDNPYLLDVHKLYQYDLGKQDMKLMTRDYSQELKDVPYVPLLPLPNRSSGTSTMFCRICTWCMAECTCEAPRFIRPFEYQINQDGRTFKPDPKEDIKKPETTLLTTTSVPGVYQQSALTEWCSRCQKEKQFCFCDVKVLTPAKRDALAVGRKYSSFKSGEPHFIGYKRMEYTPLEAKKLLNKGCSECKAVCSLGVKSYWIDEDWYFCEDCHQDPDVVETLKGTSTYLGKFMYPENYSETKH